MPLMVRAASPSAMAFTSSGWSLQKSAICSKDREVFSTSQTAVAFGIRGDAVISFSRLLRRFSRGEAIGLNKSDRGWRLYRHNRGAKQIGRGAKQIARRAPPPSAGWPLDRLDQPALGEVAHQRAGAEGPRLGVGAMDDAFGQPAELRRGDGDDVADLVGEALARARRDPRSARTWCRDRARRRRDTGGPCRWWRPSGRPGRG